MKPTLSALLSAARAAGNPFVMGEVSEDKFMYGVVRGWYCWCGMEHTRAETCSVWHRFSNRAEESERKAFEEKCAQRKRPW